MKYYDKIFFLVSLIVLGASAGYYFLGVPEIQKVEKRVSSLLAQTAKGVVWNEIKVPPMEIKQIEWPEVRPQDEDGRWFFQVFTPPQIWVDNDGKFITESPYIKEQARQSFALKYGGVSNEPYPIKYICFMGSPDDPRIQFQHEVTKVFFTGKINQPVTMQAMKDGAAKTVDMGLIIKSFDRKRIKNADNTLTEEIKLVVFDKQYGKEITVYSDKPTVIEDSRRMTFILPGGEQWHVKVAGETKDVGDASYAIESVDFDKGNAIVVMTPKNKEIEPQTMNLSEAGVIPVKKAKK